MIYFQAMADYCSSCETEYFDIYLAGIALSLARGNSMSFLCEGCTRRCLFKDEDGVLYVGFLEGKELKLQAVRIEDL